MLSLEAHLAGVAFATKFLLIGIVALLRICPAGVVLPFVAHLTGVAFAIKSLHVEIVMLLRIHLIGVMMPLEDHLLGVAFCTKFLLTKIMTLLGICLAWLHYHSRSTCQGIFLLLGSSRVCGGGGSPLRAHLIGLGPT
jgi:hypothetical protein